MYPLSPLPLRLSLPPSPPLSLLHFPLVLSYPSFSFSPLFPSFLSFSLFSFLFVFPPFLSFRLVLPPFISFLLVLTPSYFSLPILSFLHPPLLHSPRPERILIPRPFGDALPRRPLASPAAGNASALTTVWSPIIGELCYHSAWNKGPTASVIFGARKEWRKIDFSHSAHVTGSLRSQRLILLRQRLHKITVACD